jgi:hypothetical protein
MSIIAISGYARSGKDTLAEYLCEMLPDARPISFAKPLKELVYRLYPDIAELVDKVGWEQAKDTATQDIVGVGVRKTLQHTGETCRAILGQDIWVDTLIQHIDTAHTWIVTDLRYLNEAEKLWSLGATLVRIERPGVGPANDHISETNLDSWTQWDIIVANDRSLADLRESARHLVNVHTNGAYTSGRAR